MTAPQLAVRTRKARTRSVCSLCDRIIHTGNTIGKLPGRAWAHASCIVAANRNVCPEQPDGTTKGITR